MKRGILTFGLILSCIISLSRGQSNNCCNQNLVIVTGQGENRIQPDLAYIYASLVADGSTAQNAMNEIENLLSEIVIGLESNGVNLTDIMTSSISVYPKYSLVNFTNTVSGYIVFLSLTITVRDIEANNQKLVKVIDELGSVGVMQISGITYDTYDPNSGKETASTNAFDDASAKAKLFARLSGKKLGNITLIEETSFSYSPYYSSSINMPSSFSTTDFLNAQPQGSSSSGSGSNTVSSSNPELPIGTLLITSAVTASWELV